MSVTIHHDWDYYWNKNDTVNLKPKNASFLEPAEISSGKKLFLRSKYNKVQMSLIYILF